MVTFESLIERRDKIAVVGLGYVGLPLAVHLSEHFNVMGYDLKDERIKELKSGFDRTMEVSKERLGKTEIFFTGNPKELSGCKLIIVAVPTPIDEYRIPDLSPLRGASKIVGKHMVKGSCIVFESTVFPGATEEVCAPILEKESGLTLGMDFTLGYSPERINPGDKVHTIDKIIKIVSGSDDKTRLLLSEVYGKIVKAGIHQASSIKVAEAAKVIENTQRDLNIALMNELAMIFDKAGIDTNEVLEAAGTKWNFLPFRPGLVGGHCIGVDPYYLTVKAESLGYHPEMILAGRRINDGMAKYIAEKVVKLLIGADKQVHGAKVAVLGITFKEDVP
ncbi:MAG: nucleotide sugar dehydrogenase, partial [Thermodesulfobacteriota bacterium]|nr:nucleotide sugar dehydrogenase [Thermodesulfobacteriota bacterium]